ncbi:MAG: hypothetical protein ACREMH_01300 [Gemmatimonadales bacterium]
MRAVRFPGGRVRGELVGRRGVKEYRPAEALALISADRGHCDLICPSCASRQIERNPPRDTKGDHPGRVTLHCASCSRTANYLVPMQEPSTARRPEEPGGQEAHPQP